MAIEIYLNILSLRGEELFCKPFKKQENYPRARKFNRDSEVAAPTYEEYLDVIRRIRKKLRTSMENLYSTRMGRKKKTLIR